MRTPSGHGANLPPIKPASPGEPIRLLVRGDDMGSCHAANEAAILCYKNGIMRSAEVMVPGPWFNEAVAMLRENPGLDVGVHLTLTSEWSNIKWGPLTCAPSLVDRLGKFHPRTSQSDKSSTMTGFLQGGPDLKEVEKELRAQIEIAVERIPQVSHLTAHMGTPVATPELRKLTERLAKEYDLPLDAPQAKRLPRWSGSDKASGEKVEALIGVLRTLGPGDWLTVEHPGLFTPEMRSIHHPGYENVARDRAGVTAAWTSSRVKSIIEMRGIELISYADLYAEEEKKDEE